MYYHFVIMISTIAILAVTLSELALEHAACQLHRGRPKPRSVVRAK